MNGRKFVLSSFAAALVIGGALAVFRPATGESEDVRPGYWIEKLQAPERVFDIVIVGDSRAYRGLDPSLLPGRALNFGFSGAALDPHYVHTAVQKLRPGGTLVVAVSPHSLTALAREANAFDALQARHAADLALTRWASPGYAWTRPYTMSQVAALTRGRAALLAPASPSEAFHPGGFVASARPSVGSAPETARIYAEMLEAHPVGEQEIMDLTYLLTGYLAGGYRVVVLRLPVSPDVLAAERLDNAWLKQQIVGTGLEWFECPPGDTYDGSHLTADSAREASEALARFLAR
jgi:hypothetical protein